MAEAVQQAQGTASRAMEEAQSEGSKIAANTSSIETLGSGVANALNYQQVEKGDVTFAVNRTTLTPAAKAVLDMIAMKVAVTAPRSSRGGGLRRQVRIIQLQPGVEPPARGGGGALSRPPEGAAAIDSYCGTRRRGAAGRPGRRRDGGGSECGSASIPAAGPACPYSGVWGRRYHAGLCFASAAVSPRPGNPAGGDEPPAGCHGCQFAARTSLFHRSSYFTGAPC